jgi:arylsulfatase A-like enzyme
MRWSLADVLLAKLKELNLDNDMLIFFLSDNGGPTTVNGSRNTPLRGNKGQVYEGGLRVPFLVRWPARLPQGKTYDDPVICLDILPTAVAAAGGKLPEKTKLDGVDLLPHLLGTVKSAPHETLFWRTGGGASGAIRQGKLKLVKIGDAPHELYDLASDIGESKNLAADQPERVAQLLKLYQAWNSELIAPLWQNPMPAKKTP